MILNNIDIFNDIHFVVYEWYLLLWQSSPAVQILSKNDRILYVWITTLSCFSLSFFFFLPLQLFVRQSSDFPVSLFFFLLYLFIFPFNLFSLPFCFFLFNASCYHNNRILYYTVERSCVCVYICVCGVYIYIYLCVCVWERERERERDIVFYI